MWREESESEEHPLPDLNTKGACSGALSDNFLICERGLGHLDQLNLAILAAMQHLYLALAVPEDEDIAVAELAFLDGFLHRHRAQRDGILGTDQMRLGGARH